MPNDPADTHHESGTDLGDRTTSGDDKSQPSSPVLEPAAPSQAPFPTEPSQRSASSQFDSVLRKVFTERGFSVDEGTDCTTRVRNFTHSANKAKSLYATFGMSGIGGLEGSADYAFEVELPHKACETGVSLKVCSALDEGGGRETQARITHIMVSEGEAEELRTHFKSLEAEAATQEPSSKLLP